MLCASVALASTWVQVGSNNSLPQEPKCQLTDKIDSSTMQSNGNVIRAWSKMTYGPNHVSCSQEHNRVVSALRDYNCSDKTYQLIAGCTEDWVGKLDSIEFGDTQPWEHAAPDSAREIELDYVCAAH